MNRTQMENVYKANGLKDYILKSTEDLIKVHGVEFKATDGYNMLDDLNKGIYERFIINFFNAHGLEYRDIAPKGIYYVEETESKNYLRFQYEHQGRSAWLHIVNGGKEWY